MQKSLTDTQVIEMRRRARGGETHRSLSKAYGLHVENVGRIVRGETYAHLNELAPPVFSSRVLRPGHYPDTDALTKAQVLVARILLDQHLPTEEIARRLGVHRAAIYDIAARRRARSR